MSRWLGFLGKGGTQRPTESMITALKERGLPGGAPMQELRVVTSHGQYAGRGVTHVRVFSPKQAAEWGARVERFRDLDTQEALVLGAGHMERDGTVVLTKPASAGSEAVRSDRAAATASAAAAAAGGAGAGAGA